MNTTRKSLFWNVAHSWWILLTFTFYLNGIAFLYIGTKVKHKRWSIFGVIYSLPIIFTIIVILVHPEFGILPTISMILLFSGGLISIIHAFRIRREFLIRLEGQQNVKDDLLHQIESEYGLGPDVPKDTHSDRPVPKTVFTRGLLTRQS
ncbi:hypothetical protein [Paenibacillus glacialis]|uniref:Uncharacterized protein n=1 Tax=Paenibacillus glacialis TaxID=494026 RepID=A0A168F988_9BACL|nr:hypothetical protein [Paenibacillus glacialis]OAB35981.1 hypothetical protein PGLA_21385 [Paenibacillus glacialis]